VKHLNPDPSMALYAIAAALLLGALLTYVLIPAEMRVQEANSHPPST
jgi:hypothetical protein